MFSRPSYFDRILAVTVAAFALAGPALADKPSWAGHGRDKQEHSRGDHDGRDRPADPRMGATFTEKHRHDVRDYYAHHYTGGKHCPPGLARKNNGCLPPGQAKLLVGKPIPRDVRWYAVPQPVVVMLPPVPPGYRYVRVGADIVLLSPQTALVVDVIAAVFG